MGSAGPNSRLRISSRLAAVGSSNPTRNQYLGALAAGDHVGTGLQARLREIDMRDFDRPADVPVPSRPSGIRVKAVRLVSEAKRLYSMRQLIG